MFYETFVKVAPCIIVAVVVWIFCVCILCPSIGKLITDYKKRLIKRRNIRDYILKRDCRHLNAIFDAGISTVKANETLKKLFYVNQSGLIDIRKTVSTEDDFFEDDPKCIVEYIEESDRVEKPVTIRSDRKLQPSSIQTEVVEERKTQKRLPIVHYISYRFSCYAECGLNNIASARKTRCKVDVTCKTCQRTKIFKRG